jgi:hypothetical protein
MSPREWESSFLAVSALLGQPLESSLAAVGEVTTAEAQELVRSLRSSSRETRAKAIARAASQAALEVDAARIG